MVGWHHQCNGHEFEQAPGDGDGQASLVCCSPWGCKESDKTEQLNNNSGYRRMQARPKGHFPGLPEGSSVFFSLCIALSVSLCSCPCCLPCGDSPGRWQEWGGRLVEQTVEQEGRQPGALSLDQPVTTAGSQAGLGPESWLMSSEFVPRPLCSLGLRSL